MKEIFSSIFLVISLIIMNAQLFAQDTCVNFNRIQTGRLISGMEKIKFPLSFFISKDSIKVSPDSFGKKEFMAFEILSRKCSWNTDSTGSTIFLLKIEDQGVVKYPKLVINFLNPSYKIIELLYEDSERREFDILNY